MLHKLYLKSDIWQRLRAQALERSNYICKVCGSWDFDLSKLQVHHITYDRIGGDETPEDLKVVCFNCHQQEDKKREQIQEKSSKEQAFLRRFEGWAKNKYGEGYWYERNEEEKQDEFVRFLYNLECKKNRTRSDFESLEFMEFENKIRYGM